MSRDVEKQAAKLTHTSVQDALSGAYGHSVAVLKRAVQLEQKRSSPRIALLRGLMTEIRKKERAAALAPKMAA